METSHATEPFTTHHRGLPATSVPVVSTHLSILEHLLQALLHLLQLTGLDAAVGQQHAPKLSLADAAVHRVVPLELEEGRETEIECCEEGRSN